MDDTIIELDQGWRDVKRDGIDPFIDFVETTDKEFFSAKDFVQLYDKIFKMCIQREPYNWSEALYNNYTQSILGYLRDTVAPKLEQVNADYHVAFLKEWTTRWGNQIKVVRGFSKLFMYLDRFYTVTTDGVLKLEEQGYKQFKDIVYDRFSVTSRNAILKCVLCERDGEQQNRTLLKEAVQVFVGMGYNYNDQKIKLYKSDLEIHLVNAAGDYYKRKSRTWLDQDSCPTYLEKAEKVINEEINRVDTYLHRDTNQPLVRECYLRLLKDHQEELLGKSTGIDKMLTDNATEDLARMYNLYSRYPSDLNYIANLVLVHIKKAGETVVRNAAAGGNNKDGEQANHTLVKDLINLHAQYNSVVKNCFQGSQVFHKALKKAFEDFINVDNKVSKLLAKFVNDVLKKGTKTNVKDVEGTLDNVVFIYGYIQEKDVFERDYQIHLQTRLLKGQCESELSEKFLIAKLKAQAGYTWTNKLEGMFKDMQLSKEIMEEFKASRKEALGAFDLTFDVTICKKGYWPSSKVTKCTMPDVLKGPAQLFHDFYINKNSGRKLEWRMDQGQAEVQTAFSKTVKRGLVCSPYQMMIMLLFSTAKVVTYQQVLDYTGIQKYEVANHILSLCHPKVQILLKRPNTKDLEESHKFMINPKFAPPTLQVQVPVIKTVSNPDEESADDAYLKVQRNHMIDAAVVRIMKSRKIMKHAALSSEVLTQVRARFQPSGNTIKKRIEIMIEREYLERDANDRSTYNYLA